MIDDVIEDGEKKFICKRFSETSKKTKEIINI